MRERGVERSPKLMAASSRAARIRSWCAGVVALGGVVGLCVGPIQAAQSAPEPVLKAAFLLNFVRFTGWPPGSPGDPEARVPMVLCVADPEVAAALNFAAANERVANRDLIVRPVRPADILHDCALLYIGRDHARRVPPILTRLEGRAVLTVSDADHFVADGGMIQLYRRDGGIRFDIGLDAAVRARLRLSSRLLQLARPHDR